MHTVENYAQPVDNTLLCRVSAEHVRVPGFFGRRSYSPISWNYLPDRLRDPSLSSESFS